MTARLALLSLCALALGCSAGLPDDADPADGGLDAPQTPDGGADLAVSPEVSTRDDAARPDVPSPTDAPSDRVPVADLPSRDAVASDVSPMFPAFLHDGRTFDQERDYIAWEGAVNTVTLRHRDGTSLPAGEGGASCGAGCDESVTRIAAGGRIWGRFSFVQTFSVQLASSSDPGVGVAQVEVCGAPLPPITLRGGTSATPGFTNQPQPAFAVPTAGDCIWSVRSVGGYVDLRAVDVHYRGGAPPSVDVRIDGMNSPPTYDAPARYLVSWTSTSAARCTASGAWTGARDVTGAEDRSDVPPGVYAYTMVCENGAGTATDTATVTVRRPPG